MEFQYIPSFTLGDAAACWTCAVRRGRHRAPVPRVGVGPGQRQQRPLGGPAGHRPDGYAVPRGPALRRRHRAAQDLGRVRRGGRHLPDQEPEELPDQRRPQPGRVRSWPTCGRPACARSSSTGSRRSPSTWPATRRKKVVEVLGRPGDQRRPPPTTPTSPTSGTRAWPAASTPPGSPPPGGRSSCRAPPARPPGKWRAADCRSGRPATTVSGNWGGSTDAVLKSTKNPIAAAQLAQLINTDPESTLKFATEQFLFPATNDVLTDPTLHRPGVGVLRRPEGQRDVRRDLRDRQHRLRLAAVHGLRVHATATRPSARRSPTRPTPSPVCRPGRTTAPRTPRTRASPSPDPAAPVPALGGGHGSGNTRERSAMSTTATGEDTVSAAAQRLPGHPRRRATVAQRRQWGAAYALTLPFFVIFLAIRRPAGLRRLPVACSRSS